jgi:putative transposase
LLRRKRVENKRSSLESASGALARDKKNQYLMLDSTIVRAHQQAATGRKKGARTRLWGVPEEV